MDATAICDRFQRELAASLGAKAIPEGLTIALTLHQRGAIDARLTRTTKGASADYPVISVDALDRALQPSDLGRLARTAAQVLAEPTPASQTRPAAHHKGE